MVRILAAGRSAPLEPGRGAIHNIRFDPYQSVGVGHLGLLDKRIQIESIIGDLLALHLRADLRVKVEARLEMLFRSRLRLQWGPGGVELSFGTEGDLSLYGSNFEASGIIQLVGLVAALYDEEAGALLIDEPEMSLHPLLQAFLLREMLQVAGNPYEDPTKKVIVLSTHSPSMLSVRSLAQISDLVFFTNRRTPPRQVPGDAAELQNRKLQALIARLGESHRVAVFANAVLLVEGPSDEIIVNGLISRLNIPIFSAGTQIVPVTGKEEISETAKLFRLMAKRVVCLVDLDAVADDNALVNTFSTLECAREVANQYGQEALTDLDRPIRSRVAEMTANNFDAISPLAARHAYIAQRSLDTEEEKARRRAVWAVLLTAETDDLTALVHGEQWSELSTQVKVLLAALEEVGCFVLRRGTIEDYYLHGLMSRRSKPESAAAEAAAFAGDDEQTLITRYGDVIRAVTCAAPLPGVDDNAFLRRLLAGMLATVFQLVTPDLSNDALNAAAAGGDPAATSIFQLENVSKEHNTRAVRVQIVSRLFPRDGFPFDITYEDNLNLLVARKLPS